MDITISGLPDTINKAELQEWVKRFVEIKLIQPTKAEQDAQTARQTLAREAVSMVSVKTAVSEKVGIEGKIEIG